VGSNSLLDLLLGSSDHIIDLGSDLLNLLLSIEALSDLLISLDETFKLLLEAVILIVQVGHVLIEGINLRLEVDLVSHHLLRVLLESVDLVGNRLLVLLELVVFNFELRALELVVLWLDVLVLVGFEKLGLSVLVLLVLRFKVPELAIKLVQSIFLLLDDLVAFSNFHWGSDDCFFLWSQ
jgi:hypothetical protein